MPASDPKQYLGRIDEEYIVTQWHSVTKNDFYRARNARIQELKRIYRGDWLQTFPDGTVQKVKPLVENLVKNAIHDVAGLAHQARSSVKFVPESEDEKGYAGAHVRDTAAETIYDRNRGRRLEHKWYIDLVGTSMAVSAVSFSKGRDSYSDYARFVRLNPEYCFANVRNGALIDMVYTETLKASVADAMYPQAGIKDDSSWSKDVVSLIEYYDDEEVVRAVVLEPRSGSASSPKAKIIERWVHGLECVPVAYVELDSLDDSNRGMIDQVEGSLTARNAIVQYMQDYIESMVHAPFEEKNVLNNEDMPGPFTIYHHDSTAQDSFMRRVPPAAPAPAVFGLLQYLDRESSGEAVQPPARQGTVTQSIASASFVNSTLGRLTTVVSELQDLMADFRRQLTYTTFAVERKWLDTEKPLIHPIGRKRTYKPSRDIGEPGTYYCTVQFGAMAGLDKLQGDTRVLQHLGARLISRQTAREQIDYLDDPGSIQDVIDKEDMMEAFKQRIAQDPRVSAAVVAKIIMSQAEGNSLIDAIKVVAPELIAEQQAQTAPQPGQAPVAGTTPSTLVAGEVPSPVEQQQTLQKGGVPEPGFGAIPLRRAVLKQPR